MSWLLPSKSSGRVSRPFGPSKRYSLSTFSQGRARRWWLSSSRSRVIFFSFARNFLRASIQALCDTTRCFPAPFLACDFAMSASRVDWCARLILYSSAGKIGERNMKKLHRFVEDRKIAGVCGGLGDYFDLDPVFFRLFFLVSLLFGGLGALAYLILWILVPEKTGAEGEPRPLKRLYLSSSDRHIGRVGGGLGERFEIDPVLVPVAL